MLEAKTAKVGPAHGLLGYALSPMGSEVKLKEYKVSGILPGVCAFTGMQRGRFMDWVKKKLLPLEEKVGQHCDRKEEQDEGLRGRDFARSL